MQESNSALEAQARTAEIEFNSLKVKLKREIQDLQANLDKSVQEAKLGQDAMENLKQEQNAEARRLEAAIVELKEAHANAETALAKAEEQKAWIAADHATSLESLHESLRQAEEDATAAAAAAEAQHSKTMEEALGEAEARKAKELEVVTGEHAAAMQVCVCVWVCVCVCV